LDGEGPLKSKGNSRDGGANGPLVPDKITAGVTIGEDGGNIKAVAAADNLRGGDHSHRDWGRDRRSHDNGNRNVRDVVGNRRGQQDDVIKELDRVAWDGSAAVAEDDGDLLPIVDHAGGPHDEGERGRGEEGAAVNGVPGASLKKSTVVLNVTIMVAPEEEKAAEATTGV